MSYKIDQPMTAHSFSGSRAARMLSEGLKRVSLERGLSLRSIAKQLGYKQATVLSHMANGRVPIPLERAPEIARAVGLSDVEFFVASVEQRSHEAAYLLASARGEHRNESYGLAYELKLISGKTIEELNDEQKSVLREVVADPTPSRRWLSVAELPTVIMLRNLRPELATDGLPPADHARLEATLRR